MMRSARTTFHIRRPEQSPRPLLILFLALFTFLLTTGSGCVSEEIPDKTKSDPPCSSLKEADIRQILSKLNAPAAEIISIEQSPVDGLCEVAIALGNRGNPQVFYLDRQSKYIVFGQMIDIAKGANRTAEKAKTIRDSYRIDTSNIPLEDALILGDGKVSRRVIVFTDPDCPYCRALHKTLKQITAKRKDIAFYIKLFPISYHKEAYGKSKSILCSKSLKMLDDAFDKKEIPKASCETDAVDKTVALAQSLGIRGTPTMILPDGRVVPGALPEEEILKRIDEKPL
ncbi:MAG: DsbC family protein [Deltaproteobacteria bacterium]|nr:DsbC family protein [Deltaproteobacteria bacterium]